MRQSSHGNHQRAIRTDRRASASAVSPSNLQGLNTILYVAKHGGKCRGLPNRFGISTVPLNSCSATELTGLVEHFEPVSQQSPSDAHMLRRLTALKLNELR